MQVKATPRFEKMLRKLPGHQQRLVVERSAELSSDPNIGKMLAGPLRGMMSLRIGDYRVLYYVDTPKNTIWLVAVGHRKKIYD